MDVTLRAMVTSMSTMPCPRETKPEKACSGTPATIVVGASSMGTLLREDSQPVARIHGENAGLTKCPRQESNLRPKD